MPSRARGTASSANSRRTLRAGDYIFKAEGLAADGVTILSPRIVPFQQQAAQAEPAAPAVTAQADANAAPAQPDANAQPHRLLRSKPKAVIIRRGDTLWQISRRIYGRGVRYSTIYLANQDAITDPNRIFPGQVFKVPEKTPEGDAADRDGNRKARRAGRKYHSSVIDLPSFIADIR